MPFFLMPGTIFASFLLVVYNHWKVTYPCSTLIYSDFTNTVSGAVDITCGPVERKKKV